LRRFAEAGERDAVRAALRRIVPSYTGAKVAEADVQELATVTQLWPKAVGTHG
jgi:hypothetical protein